jgi:hypothetical protein
VRTKWYLKAWCRLSGVKGIGSSSNVNLLSKKSVKIRKASGQVEIAGLPLGEEGVVCRCVGLRSFVHFDESIE